MAEKEIFFEFLFGTAEWLISATSLTFAQNPPSMATPKSVAFHTLGCKLNYSESNALARNFEKAGYSVRPFEEEADVYVINTCSVTDFADRQCRKIVRKALRQSPEAKVIVTGCYAQLKPKEIAEIPGVDLVLGAAEKFQMVDYLDQFEKVPGKGMVQSGEIHTVTHFREAFSFGDRTRSFLKIQDGCDYNCSFCTIPLARGKSRSNTVASVVERARQLGEEGIREIILTGVNIGDFGKGEFSGVRGKEETFLDLIVALDEVETVDRFRISSIEPNLCSDEIIEFVAGSKRIMPHFHMPLQSGNDKLLKLMRRRYKSELYMQRVSKIKELMPHACIGVDVIVGFPGESLADFQVTYDFLDELPVSYFHVFTYSERPNTPAAEMGDKVSVGERRRRNKLLRELSEKKKAAFYKQFEGDTRPVLFEKSTTPGMMSGYTDNYIRIEVREEVAEVNSIGHLLLNGNLV